MSRSFLFILLMGIVSLFADITYEGARGLIGAYFAYLGANGFIVGFVSGLGEFAGYSLRLVSGYLSDKTRFFWSITAMGYVVNLVAVPLLGLANRWEIAAALMISERIGKAIRNPPRDAMLSYASKQTGRGWGFAIHESLDQIGAVLGPLIVTSVQAWKGSYQITFGMLAIPAICALAVLLAARISFPKPEKLEVKTFALKSAKFTGSFRLFVLGVSLIALGFADFPLIAFHLQKTNDLSTEWIPILYAIAMAVDGIAALIFGKLFDRFGMRTLAIAALISAFFAPFAFSSGFVFPLIGMILWGISLGSQESIVRASVAHLTVPEKRATAFGIMYFFYGLSWFIGSASMGALYDVRIAYLILFSVFSQLIATAIFLKKDLA